MKDGLLTASTNWHEQQALGWRLLDRQRELDELLKTLSYRTTDGEYSKFIATIRNKPITAIQMIRNEIQRVNRVSAPEVLQARDRLEMACRDLDHIKETYGENSHLVNEPTEHLRKIDAELVAIIAYAAEHPEILDAAAEQRDIDGLRGG